MADGVIRRLLLISLMGHGLRLGTTHPCFMLQHCLSKRTLCPCDCGPLECHE
jgi:hypothetical protein